ncbi:MAG: DUF106 domain-containing protein [Candidatus Aenigmarchaeota archaeon]|nr:DUF106 domain-containing protein [Candidatus Aenigmarchaeota archaeon]
MVLEFLFNPLLSLSPALAVLIFSGIILVIINVFYKVLINQNAAKAIKDRQKEISKKLQAERKAGNTDKMNALMKESLQENSKLMRMTLKPMIVSFIIVIIFLPWLHSVYGDGFGQISDSKGTVKLNGVDYSFSIDNNGITVDNAAAYKGPCDAQCVAVNGNAYEITREGDKVKFGPIVASLPFALPLLGYTAGWLGWYILVSIPLVIIIRKLMKIYV